MWIDSPDEQGMRRLITLVQERHHLNPQARIHALLDLSFAEAGLRGSIAEAYPHACNLLQGHYAGAGLDRVDSSLMELPQPADESMMALMRLCAGRPMLSFILASATLEQLQAHLRQQLEAQDDQGDVFILRWADTRCLPTLHQCLDDLQRSRLMSGINAWLYLGRNGEPQVISASAQQTLPPHRYPVPYTLDTTQIQAIRAGAHPDALLSLIASRPHLYGTLAGQPSLRHAVVRSVLQRTDGPTYTGQLLRAIAESLQAQGLLEEKMP
ncbi:DUF4123 domain-containing protein [Pseudomonas aeruginosa]|nr:DUF4123 domain-containing protein [Pseudomonas aeruginosa]